MEEGKEEVAFLERSGAEQSGAEPSAAELLATGSRREDHGGGRGGSGGQWHPGPHFSLPLLVCRACASLSLPARTSLFQEAFGAAPTDLL